jgi:predicted RNA-binding Zn-ribbon protein involved in translation (DUF1610 family)
MSAFKCPKCGFVQLYATLRAVDGAVFDNPRTTAHHTCPNDGTTLVMIRDDDESKQRRRRNAARLIVSFIAALLIVLAAGFKFYTGM